MCTKLITINIQKDPRTALRNIVFLTLLVTLNLGGFYSSDYVYAQEISLVSTNTPFFGHLSKKITEKPFLKAIPEISLKTELPVTFAQQLRSALVKKNVTINEKSDQHLYITVSTNNRYRENTTGNVDRRLAGTLEILIKNDSGTVTHQELIDYEFKDSIAEEDFNRLATSEFTEPDAVEEAPKSVWEKFGIPAIILSGIGTATVLLFYVRG